MERTREQTNVVIPAIVGLHAQAHVDAVGHHIGRDQVQGHVEDTGEAVEQHVAHLEKPAWLFMAVHGLGAADFFCLVILQRI